MGFILQLVLFWASLDIVEARLLKFQGLSWNAGSNPLTAWLMHWHPTDNRHGGSDDVFKASGIYRKDSTVEPREASDRVLAASHILLAARMEWR